MKKLIIALLFGGSLAWVRAQETGEYSFKGSVSEIKITAYNALDSAGIIQKLLVFDRRGLLTEETLFAVDSSDSKRWIYSYDSLSRKIEMKTYDFQRNLIAIERYTYSVDGSQMYGKNMCATLDEKGNILREISLADGCITYAQAFSYNRNSQVTNIKAYYPYDNKFVCGNGVDLKKIPLKWNEPMYEDVYQYDNFGHVREIDVITDMETPYTKFRFDHVLDEAHNWTTQMQYGDEYLLMIIVREIKYHPQD